MRRLKYISLISGICLFFLVIVIYADLGFSQSGEVIEQIGTNGKVNWSAGTVEATGIGAPPEQYNAKSQAAVMALRHAKMEAYRNLFETSKGIRVDSATEVKDFAITSDTIRARIEELVKAAQVTRRDFMSDGTVEVTMRMSIKGDFAQVIIPIPKIPKSDSGTMATSIVPMVSKPTVSQMEPAKPAINSYTGIIVDARGLQAQPAMVPRIVDENEMDIYGPMLVERDYAVQLGMSGYTRDPGSAQMNPRVTNNPITVKGLRAAGPNRSNIVISDTDAEKLKAAAENMNCMKKARVVVVLD